MNKALSFIRLDFITIKPYLTLKNLLIFIGVALIMIIANTNAGAVIGILMVFAALYASYPFVIGEKSNIDVLYTTLSIKRNTVVLGRYLFALTLDLFAGLFTFIFSFILLTVMQRGFDFIESLSAILILFLLFSVIQAVQLPIYFKLGYTKAKFLAYLPFIALPLLIMAFSNVFDSVLSIGWISGMLGWFSANLLAAVLMGAAMWLVIMSLSFKIALSFYKKRDF